MQKGHQAAMAPISKRYLSEDDIRARYIDPAIAQAGWQLEQVRRNYKLTAGRVFVRGQMTARGKIKRADYVLFYKSNFPLVAAIVVARQH